MKRLIMMAVTAVTLAVAARSDAAVLRGNTYRIQDGTNASYAVSSVFETAAWPEDVPTPSFRFDCKQTNGWSFATDDKGRLRVTRIPTLVANSPRFLTADMNDSGSTFPLWNEGAKVLAPVFVAADPELGNQPALDLSDGKSLNSKMGLIFDAQGDSEGKSQLRSVGTVVAVYGSQLGGGSLLGGGVVGNTDHVWTRHRVQTLSSENPDAARVDYPAPLAGAAAGLSFRTGLARHFGHVSAPRDSGLSGGWEVLSVVCADNDMPASGIGLGNVGKIYYHSGGMKIAELIVFGETLTDEQVARVERHLARKWFPGRREDDGYNGRTSLGWYRSAARDASLSTTFDVPQGETLEIGKLQGGRTRANGEPKVVKTGAGALDVGDFADYGGTVESRGGKLVFRKRTVPTVDRLPPGLFLRLDPNDAACPDVADPSAGRKHLRGLRNLASGTWQSMPVAAHQPDAALQPWLRENEVGGKSVIDFGQTSEGEGLRVLRFAKDCSAVGGGYSNVAFSSVCTVVALVGAKNGGGHVMNNMFRRARTATSGTRPFSDFTLHDVWNKIGLLMQDVTFGTESARKLNAATGRAFVNGRKLSDGATGYETPGYQVAAWCVPGYACSHLGGIDETGYRGNLCLGEILVWLRPLSDEELQDAQAYLAKKWLDRTLAGYADDARAGVAQVQKLDVLAQTEIAAEGDVRIGRLAGQAEVVKTGAGTLYVGTNSHFRGGLVIRAGAVKALPPVVTEKCRLAAGASMHLDASATQTFTLWPRNGTNYVHRWRGVEGLTGGVTSRVDSSPEGGKPERNNPWLDGENTLNGLPCVNFGRPHYSWGRANPMMLLDHGHDNVRSAFVVLGSQNGGNDLFGSGNTTFDADCNRHVDWLSVNDGTRRTALFHATAASANIVNGEIFVDGVKTNHTANPAGWSLVECHTLGGVHVSALNCRQDDTYNRGGNRYCEIVIYERPLSEREKVATRNYLTRKWFPERPLQDLPPETPAPAIDGDLSYAPGAAWHVAVSPDGKTDLPAVTGSFSFGAGVTVSLTGLSALGELSGRKIVLARAGAFSGLENVAIACDVPVSSGDRPVLKANARGELYVRFGQKGFVFVVR